MRPIAITSDLSMICAARLLTLFFRVTIRTEGAGARVITFKLGPDPRPVAWAQLFAGHDVAGEALDIDAPLGRDCRLTVRHLRQVRARNGERGSQRSAPSTTAAQVSYQVHAPILGFTKTFCQVNANKKSLLQENSK
jgi:hypothetical protein